VGNARSDRLLCRRADRGRIGSSIGRADLQAARAVGMSEKIDSIDSYCQTILQTDWQFDYNCLIKAAQEGFP
jgi:hypothetical protein